MTEKTRVRLRIVGSEFVVSADEDKDYIVKISNMVDDKIKELLREGDSMNVSMAAILAALNYCDELEKEKIITEELLRRTETSENIALRASSELEALRLENKQLKEVKLGLHKVIDELKAKLSGEVEAEVKIEESPQQLRIHLPQDEPVQQAHEEVKPEQEQIIPQEEPKQEATPQTVQPVQQPTPQPTPQPIQPTQPKPETESVPAVSTIHMTARQMLEEKRKALLAQKNTAKPASASNQSRPKPFRPVTSAKSGGGAFPGNRPEPKINYRDNDKISESYRRSEFADAPAENDMLTFFDHR